MLLQINAADFLLDLASGDVSTYKVTGEQAQKHLITCAEKFAEVGKRCWLAKLPLCLLQLMLDVLVLPVLDGLSSVLAMCCCDQGVQRLACFAALTHQHLCCRTTLTATPKGQSCQRPLSGRICGMWRTAGGTCPPRLALMVGAPPSGLCAGCSHMLCDCVT